MESIVIAWLVLFVVGVCTGCDKGAVDTCREAFSEKHDPIRRKVTYGEIGGRKYYQKKCRLVERFVTCIAPSMSGCDDDYIKTEATWIKSRNCGNDGQGTTSMPTSTTTTNTNLGTTKIAGTATNIPGTDTKIAGTDTNLGTTKIAGTDTGLGATKIAGTDTNLGTTKIAGTDTNLGTTKIAGTDTGLGTTKIPGSGKTESTTVSMATEGNGSVVVMMGIAAVVIASLYY